MIKRTNTELEVGAGSDPDVGDLIKNSPLRSPIHPRSPGKITSQRRQLICRESLITLDLNLNTITPQKAMTMLKSTRSSVFNLALKSKDSQKVCWILKYLPHLPNLQKLTFDCKDCPRISKLLARVLKQNKHIRVLKALKIITEDGEEIPRIVPMKFDPIMRFSRELSEVSANINQISSLVNFPALEKLALKTVLKERKQMDCDELHVWKKNVRCLAKLTSLKSMGICFKTQAKNTKTGRLWESIGSLPALKALSIIFLSVNGQDLHKRCLNSLKQIDMFPALESITFVRLEPLIEKFFVFAETRRLRSITLFQQEQAGEFLDRLANFPGLESLQISGYNWRAQNNKAMLKKDLTIRKLALISLGDLKDRKDFQETFTRFNKSVSVEDLELNLSRFSPEKEQTAFMERTLSNFPQVKKFTADGMQGARQLAVVAASFPQLQTLCVEWSLRNNIPDGQKADILFPALKNLNLEVQCGRENLKALSECLLKRLPRLEQSQITCVLLEQAQEITPVLQFIKRMKRFETRRMDGFTIKVVVADPTEYQTLRKALVQLCTAWRAKGSITKMNILASENLIRSSFICQLSYELIFQLSFS